MNWRILTYLRPLLVTILLGTAVLVGLARLLLPLFATQWHGEIEQALGRALQQQVQIERVSARWHGFGPQLRLHRLRLASPPGQNLTLAEIQVDLAPLSSLLQGRLVIDRAALVGASLQLHQQQDGSLRLRAEDSATLEGMPSSGAGFALDQLPLGIGLVDSRISLYNRHSPVPLRFEQVNLRLTRQDKGFKAQGRLQVAGETSNRLAFAAEILGDLDQPELWSGTLYLQIDNLALQTSLEHLVPNDWQISKGLLDLRLWARLEQGRLNRLEGDLKLADILLLRQLRERLSGYDLERLQGSFRWQRQDEQWRLHLADLQIARNQMQWPNGAISLQGDSSGRIDAAIDFLRLEDILSLVMLLPENRGEHLLTGLQRVQPRGDLRNLRFQQQGDLWRLEGSAEKIRTFAWGHVPAIDSLSGAFRADQNGGIARLDNRDLQFEFGNDFFAKPMRFPRLQGEVHWLRHPQGWQMGSSNIQLDTADFKTGTAFSLSIPDRGRAHLQLRTALEQGDIAYIKDYLPVGIMNPKVVEWINRALVSGRISSGQAVFDGALSDFPFDNQEEGYFDARLKTEGVILDYQSGWPRLERAELDLHFANNSFSASLSAGEISASRVTQARARIEHLFPVSPLQIDANVEGPLSDELRLLTDTPLAERLDGMAVGVEVKGDVRLGVQLQVPLSVNDPDGMQVNAQLQFIDNRIAKDQWKLELEALRGTLNYSDQEGLSAQGLQAKALGSDIKIEVRTPEEGVKRTQIRSSGLFDIQTISKRRLGMELPLAKGRSHWSLQVDLPHPEPEGQQPITVKLTSDLQGVSVDLPAPLGKQAKQRKPLLIELQPEHSPLPVHVRWGDQLDAQLLFAGDAQGTQLQAGNVRLGGTPATPPEAAGLWIRGQLSHLQLDPLLQLLATGPATDSQALMPHLDVELGLLQLFGFDLDNIHINGGPHQGGWAALIDSPKLSGKLTLPAELTQGPIILDLDHLALSLAPEKTAERNATPSSLDPRKFPSIQLTSKSLLLNGQELGRLELHTLRNEQGLDFSQFRIQSDWFNLKLRGQWQAGKPLPQCSSMFQLQTSDMGRLQKVLNGTSDLHKTPGRLEGNLTWPGSPLDFGKMNLGGELDMTLEKGSILDLEPGAGRVFGLLNLGALQRRLTLDFSDLLNKGFSFDVIKGRFKLHKGVADTNNLSIEAPTGIINLYGRTDLINKQLDQMIEVIPDITGTLATAGTLVGGPLVGAALFLANKMIGKELNKITRIRYLLKGPWDNPKITRYGHNDTTAGQPQERKRAEDPFDLH